MIRKMPFSILFVLTLALVAFPVMAQDHSGHAGHEGHEKQAPASDTEKMPAKPTPLPDKVVDVQYKVCPILGNDTQVEVAGLFEGKVYHFCCAACLGDFKKDPKGVIAKIKDAKEVPLTITNKDGKCPMTGEPASGEIFLVRGDKITFYCCAACVGKDKLEGDKSAEPKKDEKETGK